MIAVGIFWNSLRKFDVNLPAVPSVCVQFVLRETPLLSIQCSIAPHVHALTSVLALGVVELLQMFQL